METRAIQLFPPVCIPVRQPTYRGLHRNMPGVTLKDRIRYRGRVASGLSWQEMRSALLQCVQVSAGPALPKCPTHSR
jgi:hypothetical protein